MNPKTTIITLVTISVLTVGTLTGVQLVINSQVQSAVDETEIEIISLNILDFGLNTVDFAIDFEISNPQGNDATVAAFDLSIQYLDNLVGVVPIEEFSITGESDLIEILVTLTIDTSNLETFQDLVDDLT